jgi:hypothetical protein
MKDTIDLAWDEASDEAALDRVLGASDAEILALVSTSAIARVSSRVARLIASPPFAAQPLEGPIWMRLVAAAVLVICLISATGIIVFRPTVVTVKNVAQPHDVATLPQGAPTENRASSIEAAPKDDVAQLRQPAPAENKSPNAENASDEEVAQVPQTTPAEMARGAGATPTAQVAQSLTRSVSRMEPPRLTSGTPELLASAEKPIEGVFYSLPKALVDVTLLVSTTTPSFSVDVSEAKFVPDAAHTYYLQYPLTNYHDAINVEVGSNTFVRKVESTSYDKTKDVVVNVANAAVRGFEVNEAGSDLVPLTKVSIDPSDEGERLLVLSVLNKAIEYHIRTQTKVCTNLRTKKVSSLPLAYNQQQEGDVQSRIDKLCNALAAMNSFYNDLDNCKSGDRSRCERDAVEKAGTCRQSNANSNLACQATSNRDCRQAVPADAEVIACKANCTGNNARQCQERCAFTGILKCQQEQNACPTKHAGCPILPPRLTLDIARYGGRGIDPTPPQGRASPNCTEGICYRPKEPFRIDYGVGSIRRSRIVEIPNEAPLIGIDIRRALFVEKVINIEFDADGFLQEVRIGKPSETLAVSSLPLAVIDAIATGLAPRLDYLNRQVEFARRDAALIQAEASLQQTRRQLDVWDGLVPLSSWRAPR